MPSPIKTKFQFQHATAFYDWRGGERADDTVLNAIDGLLEQFHAAVQAKQKEEQKLYLAKLLHALDRWLKHPPMANSNPRIAAVKECRVNVLDQLKQETGLTEAGLKGWIAKTFGAQVSKEMEAMDRSAHAVYFNSAQREQFRLRFMSGIVYIKRWWERSPHQTLFDSARQRALAEELQLERNTDHNTTEGFANYVLTLGGEFYSAMHRPNSDGTFHSAYTGGKPVHCAGEIRVSRGIVLEINNRSGHYTPSVHRLRDAVEVLGMLGVNLRTLKVLNYATKDDLASKRQFTGDKFLEAFPPRYVVSGHQAPEIVLRNRVAGIQDVMLAPLFYPALTTQLRSGFSKPDDYPKVVDSVSRTLTQDLTTLAPSMKLRIVPLDPQIKAKLKFAADRTNFATPGLDDVRHWGADLVLVPSLDFVRGKFNQPTLDIAWHVVSKQSVNAEGEHLVGTDITSDPHKLMSLVTAVARAGLEGIVKSKD